MRIVCKYGHCAPSYIFGGWGRVLNAMGHKFMFWNPETKPIFDVFNEFKPDLFIGTTFDLDRAQIKCIMRNPEVKVILYASAWGKLVDEIDPVKYPIVRINEEEKKKFEWFKKETGKPDFVFLHLTDNYLEPVLGGWRELGIKPVGILNAADTFVYNNGNYDETLACDIGFVGGYWKYKGINLNKFIIPLCNPNKNLRVKIFGNQPWGVHQYLGFIDEQEVKNLFASATVCPNVSEPHSTDFGFDIVERPFKVALSGFCISDYVEAASKEVFTQEEMPFARTSAEFEEIIRHAIAEPEWRKPYMERARKTVLEGHTYWHRVAKMFLELGLDKESERCLQTYKNASII
jgi:hypothetical protein